MVFSCCALLSAFASFTSKYNFHAFVSNVLFKLVYWPKHFVWTAVQDTRDYRSLTFLGMCIGLVVKIDFLTIRAVYLNLGDLPQVVWMYLAHRFVKLLACCIWACVLWQQPIPYTPFTSMLQTLAATSGVKYDVITQTTYVLQVNWGYGAADFEFNV